MKKIAIVIAELAAPGGAEKVAVDLAEEFRQRDYEVTVVKFARLPVDITRYDIPVRMINLDIPERQGGLFTQITVLLRRAWQFRQLFQREQFDHIFSFLEAANVPCALACPDSVLSVHLDPSTMTRSEWLAFRWLYPRAKRVIAVSRQMQDLLEKQAHLKNVNCIYNPVNTRLIAEKSQEVIGFEGRFILGVGRLEKQKRFDLLIEAFARSKAQQDCQLLIVGRGTQQAMLEQHIKTLGMEERVVLVGFDANPYKYMAKAEFQVMSSDYEGYPLVLIEALSLGCPIVSTDCPTGPREIIRHGENGLLVEKGNVDALAAGIDTLFFDQEQCERLRQQAKESVRNNDIAAVADAWLAA
ncbi:MAG: glycosyltransferase [Candidatus Thiothrix putei]|uniref:Glycosyltransferase n=1 Tax=Candidatus Thiothrix putei TaxID=3080811 RepID=A0AA95KJY9_9GAMM|nr:MAG: glycosyltransferase [Candidatus Thiothrix putei]